MGANALILYCSNPFYVLKTSQDCLSRTMVAVCSKSFKTSGSEVAMSLTLEGSLTRSLLFFWCSVPHHAKTARLAANSVNNQSINVCSGGGTFKKQPRHTTTNISKGHRRPIEIQQQNLVKFFTLVISSSISVVSSWVLRAHRCRPVLRSLGSRGQSPATSRDGQKQTITSRGLVPKKGSSVPNLRFSRTARRVQSYRT